MAISSSCGRSRMSASVELQYSRVTIVLSVLSRMMDSMICHIGVMPVPPAMSPRCLAMPLRYRSLPALGPFTSIVSPTAMLKSAPLITPPGYSLMSRSK